MYVCMYVCMLYVVYVVKADDYRHCIFNNARLHRPMDRETGG